MKLPLLREEIYEYAIETEAAIRILSRSEAKEVGDGYEIFGTGEGSLQPVSRNNRQFFGDHFDGSAIAEKDGELSKTG